MPRQRGYGLFSGSFEQSLPEGSAVVGGGQQGPLGADVLQAAQVEAAEAEVVFEAANHRFDRGLSFIEKFSTKWAVGKAGSGQAFGYSLGPCVRAAGRVVSWSGWVLPQR